MDCHDVPFLFHLKAFSPTYTTKERRWLAQVECKQCDKFSMDNFKHKLYIVHNLWVGAPLPSQ
jgi:hypothetical protein